MDQALNILVRLTELIFLCAVGLLMFANLAKVVLREYRELWAAIRELMGYIGNYEVNKYERTNSEKPEKEV